MNGRTPETEQIEIVRNPFPDKKVASLDHERVTQYLKETQNLRKEFSVSQEDATWMFYGEYPTLPHAFVYMPDIHYGSLEVDYDMLDRHFGIVKNTPNMAVVFGGDMVDNFQPQHISSGMIGDGVPPDIQIQAMMEKMAELDRKSKVGAVCFGNHDDWTFRTAGMDFYNTFMGDFNAPIFGKGGMLHIMVGESGQKYDVGINHTHWGNSKINPTNAAKRAMDYSYQGADIALLGHIHVAAGEQFDRAGEQKIAVIGGTYKTSDTHAQKWGMGQPGKAGYTVMLWPDEKKMQLFRTPDDASAFLRGQIALLGKEGKDPYSEMKAEIESRDAQRIRELEAQLAELRASFEKPAA